MKFLPSLEQCLDICKNNEAFKYKMELINNKKVFPFTYFLATFNDFKQPISHDLNINGFELRGITFVEQNDGTYKRFLMLDKFFNVGQVQETLLSNIKDEKIISVADKRDGSLITFIEIGETIYAKSKFSFQSDQAKMAQRLYDEDNNIKEFVKYCILNNLQPFFELTSPMNQIVIRYDSTELKVIQVRSLTDGSYKDLNEFKSMFNIKFVDQLPTEQYTFEYMMKEREHLVGIEGWVVTTDKWMYKIKCVDYIRLHGLLTNEITREDAVIRMTLDEEIDDVLAEIPLDAKELRFFVESISNGIVDHVNKLSLLIKSARDTLVNDIYSERKDYVLAVKQTAMNKYFGLMMKAFEDNSEEAIEKEVIKYVKFMTSKLGMAKEYLKEIGIKAHFESKDED